MNTSKSRRRPALRWLATLGLALALLPALASDASAQYRRGGFNRGFARGPQVYSRGYGGFAPRGFNRGFGYGYAPRAFGYGARPYGFNNFNGMPYGNNFGRPGFGMRPGGLVY